MPKICNATPVRFEWTWIYRGNVAPQLISHALNVRNSNKEHALFYSIGNWVCWENKILGCFSAQCFFLSLVGFLSERKKISVYIKSEEFLCHIRLTNIFTFSQNEVGYFNDMYPWCIHTCVRSWAKVRYWCLRAWNYALSDTTFCVFKFIASWLIDCFWTNSSSFYQFFLSNLDVSIIRIE